MLSLALPQATSGQNKAGTSEQSYQMTFTVTFSAKDFSFNKLQGYDTIQIHDGGYTTEVGKPMMPLKNIRVALPADMVVSSMQILEVKKQPVDGTYTVFPEQTPLPVSSSIDEKQFIQPDAQTYASHQPYPTKLIEFTGQSDLAGQVMADITVYPMHYVPDEKKLTLVTSITLTLIGVSGYACGDYLPKHISDNNRDLYEQMIQNMVINPQNVELRTSPNPQPMGVPPGNYSYVIITQDSWVSAFQQLADWKTQKGVPATIVTTTWIYNSGGYSGTNVNKIRAFVQDVYTNWGTTYVLLGGDTNVVPCHFRTFSGVNPDPVPNDAYYADFDNDWVCEVNVGRASVTGPGSGTGQIGTFINKVLTYEINPPLVNYATNAGFFGFDLDSSTHAQQCKITIKNTYIPTDWTVSTVYDSQAGNHETNVIVALNAGQNLVNHADHSSSDYMGTGYVNHGWGIDSSDMDALSNGNKQSILYSMGCDPAAYDVSNCIAEHFVRNSNGGGVAFIGNSRYGWYNSGQYNTLSMGYDVRFFRSLFQENLYNLGAAFSDHRNDVMQSHPGDDYYQYIYTELTLLGDPELPVWTESPMSLNVTHPSQLPVGSSSFTISITSNGDPVSQAYVCLWKGTEVYLTGSTDSNGGITFDVTSSSSGTMLVTVTKQNYLPYEGSATVIGGSNNPPATPATPAGPITGITNVSYTYTTNTTDPDGDQVWYKWEFGLYTTDWFGPYASGAQAQASYAWTIPGTYEVKVRAKDQIGYESDWSNGLMVTISELKPNLTIGPITGGLLGVFTELKNIGNASATNITWNITLADGLIFSGRTQTGTVTTLSVNSTKIIEDSPILGLGAVTITVKISADGIPEKSKTANAFVFLIFIIMM